MTERDPTMTPHRPAPVGRRRALALTGAALLASVLRPGASRAQASDAAGAPADPQPLVVAFYTDFFPFSWEAAEGWRGIDVELARHVAKTLGRGLEPWPLPADESVDDDLRNAIWRGRLVDKQRADLMVHVPLDPTLAARNDLVTFVGSYHVDGLAVIFDPEQLGDDEVSLDRLAGYKVAVEMHSLAEVYLGAVQGGRLQGTLARCRRPEETVQALRDGTVQAVMGLRSQLEALSGQDRERFPLVEIPLPGLAVPRWPLGLAVRRSASELGATVEAIVAAGLRDGTIARIFAAHGVTHRPPEA